MNIPDSAAARRGQAAIVTGGASGIGRALARRFAEDGMRLAVLDVNGQRLAEVAEEIPGSLVLDVDVSDPDAVEAAAHRCVEEFGPPSVVCANAGIFGPTGRRLWELTPADWDHTLGVNLMGPVNCLRSFIPPMLQGGGGHVVITASMAAVTARATNPVYAASKHGLLAVAESLQLQVERQELPIGVSVLLPATVSTNFSESRDADFSLVDGTPFGVSAPIDPSVVAEQVIDAIDRRRFYIFTHADSRRRLDVWYEGAVEGYRAFD
jgi:NAD(P)-dependent dehydrogenase (short-subunit alcohol dehydrogenase family)